MDVFSFTKKAIYSQNMEYKNAKISGAKLIESKKMIEELYEKLKRKTTD